MFEKFKKIKSLIVISLIFIGCSSSTFIESSIRDCSDSMRGYNNELGNQFISHWEIPKNVKSGHSLQTVVEMEISSEGELLKLHLVRRSNNPEYDQSIWTSVVNTSVPEWDIKTLSNRHILEPLPKCHLNKNYHVQFIFDLNENGTYSVNSQKSNMN